MARYVSLCEVEVKERMSRKVFSASKPLSWRHESPVFVGVSGGAVKSGRFTGPR